MWGTCYNTKRSHCPICAPPSPQINTKCTELGQVLCKASSKARILDLAFLQFSLNGNGRSATVCYPHVCYQRHCLHDGAMEQVCDHACASKEETGVQSRTVTPSKSHIWRKLEAGGPESPTPGEEQGELSLSAFMFRGCSLCLGGCPPCPGGTICVQRVPSVSKVPP